MSSTTSTTEWHGAQALRRRLLALRRVKRTVRLGFKDLWSHRARSFLTALGIVFGVSSVIAMLAIGEGASYEAQEQIRRLGSNNIIIRSVKPPEEKDSTSQRTFMVEYGLTYDDVARIRETIPSVEVKVPARIMRRDIWHRGRRVEGEVYGTVPWYPEVNNHRVARGRFFNGIDFDNKTNVCVIDQAMAEKLFPIDSPIGRRVHIGTSYYRVIGVMEPRSARLLAGNGNERDSGRSGDAAATFPRMFVPLSTTKERFGEILIEMQSGSRSIERVELHEVTVRVLTAEDVVETSAIIEAVLEYGHKKKDYEIVVPLELLRQAERTKRIFNIVLGSIAAISLVVGGIGIMNIMLASVTERTREIGVRRALGAKRRDIVVQFLVETVILSGIGGVMGVVLGVTIPVLIEHFAKMETIVTLWSPVLAFGISALVGVVFGIYPAIRAADMDPVEALRHE